MNRTPKSTGLALLMAALIQSATHGQSGPSGGSSSPAAGAPASAAGANPFRTKTGAGQAGGSRYGGLPPSAASQPEAPVQVGPDSRRARCDQALLDARRALSVGDLARAQQFLDQAKQLGVAYDGPGDSPQRVEESIQLGQELAELRKSAAGGDAWRQAYAKFLVSQADALLSWNDLDTATRTANEAAQLNPRGNGAGVTPQDVLRRIAERKQGLNSIAAAPQVASPALGAAKQQTLALLADARTALKSGDLARAEALAGQASALGVLESQFAPAEDSPGRVAADLMRARAESGATELAVAGLPATATPNPDDYALVVASVEPATEYSPRIADLPEATPLPLPVDGADLAQDVDPAALLEAGEQALRAGNRAAALQSFRAAYEHRARLDVLSQQRLQGHMQMLSAAPAEGQRGGAPAEEILDSAAAGQSVIARQLSAEVGKRQVEAARLAETDPTRALAMLREARTMVEGASLDDSLKRQLLSRVDMSLRDIERYIEAHKSELELDAANREVLDEIERERIVKVEVSERVAELVDQFNKLIDEQRYAEAEVVANRLYEMAPDELVSQQVKNQANMIRRERLNRDIIAQAEEGVANQFLKIRETAADALEKTNVDFGYDASTWDRIKGRDRLSEIGSNRNIKELEIEQKLRTQVLPQYDEMPLTKVVEGLSQLAGINIHLDPRGLEQEGVRSDTPITLNLPQEISLKSALILILEPLHLTYTIKDEVLKVTSEQIRDGEVFIKTYPVGDLVIPIPNFVPTNNIGLQGLINDAYHAMGAGNGYGVPGPMAVVAGTPEAAGGVVPASSMAQFAAPAPNLGPGAGSPPSTTGPGGLGGAASADFDSLIDLIVSTVEHDTWMENGTGEGDIQPFPNNLSLVISQTQSVHEKIADLLEQLRRLQDLQVTIEVRFIRLTDSFFERIGVDFDFNIEDGTGISTDPTLPGSLVPGAPFEPSRASATVGIETAPGLINFPNYTVDLDLPFRQDSFGLATPQFGTPDDVATFGFSILSDIEAFFIIEASQGDRRANVLQAPKVTLFNGQQANVIDAAFVPFVISVIPVVGDFAAAQQPVIVVLSEGTMMTVQAVVSDDRRYVRLTLVPFFSQIGEVREFTFEGATTTSSSSSSTDDDDDGNDESNDDSEEITRSGTTVQLPTFQVISVSTTVSVPDGGTVLLGGIKRLREGRNEFGVPLLSKIPYVDRLFRNVGIGRETDSLMMMVTPHIIIQEEEEERLGVATE